MTHIVSTYNIQIISRKRISRISSKIVQSVSVPPLRMFLLKCELFLRCYCYDGTVRVVQRCGMLHMFQRGLLSALCLFGSSVCAEVHSITTKGSAAAHTFLRSRYLSAVAKVKRTLCMKQLSHFKPGLTSSKMANGVKPEYIFTGHSLSPV